MAIASKLYVKSIYERFSYLATWLPNAKLKLGDVGIREGEYFKRMSSLKVLGVSFKVRSGTSYADFTYTSQSGVKLKTKAAGEMIAGTTLPNAQAGLLIDFSKEGAFLFQAMGCLVDEIEDKIGLGREIIELYKKGNWETNWSIVDTVVKASSATIIVSNSQSASIELTAKTPLLITNLANAETGLTLNSQRGDVIRFISVDGLMPLFKLSRLKKSFLSKMLRTQGSIYFGGNVSDGSACFKSDNGVLEAVAPD
jgi:hypothetical protein